MVRCSAFSGALIIACFLWAGDTGRPGEETRNKARHAWFAEQRGLNQIPKPGSLRRSALTHLARNPRKQRVTQPSWISLGPDTADIFDWRMGQVAGRVSALAVHPSNKDILYLGTGSGGLWKTTDGGANWSPLFDEIGTLSIGSLLLDPADPETIWVGTGDHTQLCAGYFGMGLYVSTDGGANFTAKNGVKGSLLELSYIAAVAKTTAGVLLAGGHAYCTEGNTEDGGLFRSTDQGDNWTRVLDGSVGDIVTHPTDPNIVYAAVGRFTASENGIYRSQNAGLTWTRLENGIDFGSNVGRCRLAMAPSRADTLYALVNNLNGVTSLFQTQDGGNTWQLRNADACEGQCWYNLCLAVDPTEAARLLVGSIRFAKSDDAGFSLVNQVDPWGSTQLVHQDVHALVYDPDEPNRYWIGTDGGLWRTDNGGATFTNLNNSMPTTQLFDVAVRPDDPSRVYGGSMDNASMRTNGDIVWQVTFNNGDGTTNLVDPLNPDIVYQAGPPVAGLPRVIRSTTGGNPASYRLLALAGIDPTDPWPFKMPMELGIHPNGATTHLFIASDRIYRSDDRGDTVTSLSADALGGGRFSALVAQSTPTGLVVYGGTANGRIHRCLDALAANPVWQDVTNNYPAATVTDILIEPGNTDRVWITRGGFGASRLYRTTDGGDNWIGMGAGLPDVPANTVAMDPNTTGRVFVGTDLGVFESTDTGASFQPMDRGMPLGLLVLDLEVTGTVMTAASYGRGAWRISLERLVLEVEAGPDQSTCAGRSLQLNATPANGVEPLAWSWHIESGPDLDAAQLDDTGASAPTFSPTLPGTYVLRVDLTDNDTDTAFDSLTIQVGDERQFLNNQADRWLNDPGEQAELDRDGSQRIDILDMILQTNQPLCSPDL
ncbi:MAG: hypothetical protein QNK37_22875 [Acidobacteriota bacterium]|nr:hypothetical protein [Acidobacteriota bacterium]